MGEGKWIKTYVNSYDDTPSKMIDAREDRDTIHYIRGRLNALAGKVNRNGELYMTETKPYTIKTLAIEFNRDFEVVKEAIKVLKSLDVIEITENRTFKISDWEMDQNVEGLERIRKQTSERVARHRAAKKLQESDGSLNNVNNKKDGQELIENPEHLNRKDNIEEKGFEKSGGREDDIINNVELNDEINNNTEIIESNDLNCNVTVTKQNKRRVKKRSKKKDKRESKKKENNSLIEFSCDNNDFEINDDNGEDLFSESFVTEDSCFDDYIDSDYTTTFFDVSENDKPNEQAVTCFEVSSYADKTEESAKSLLKYCKNTTEIVSNITAASLKIAIDTYTEKYVKMAIDKSIEVGKFDMAYINGILNNWKREGYPRDEYEGGNINGTNSYGKGNIQDTVKFEGFKPKEPRQLTEREREITEKNLI